MGALGPSLSSDQGLAGEISRRCDALRLARRGGGSVWSSKIARPVKLLTFIAFAIGAALSGLSAFTSTKTHADAFYALLGKFPRKAGA